MANPDSDAIAQLREAVLLSPKNLPLRVAFADALLGASRAAEAEAEYRAGLIQAPGHAGLKLGLARAFQAQGKSSHALVVCEDLTHQADCPPRAFVLHARILAGLGEIAQAVEQYKRGIEHDRSVADPDFANRLGIRDEPKSAAVDKSDSEDDDPFSVTDDHDELVDGKLRASWELEDEEETSAALERPKIQFSQVGGMESLKEEIRLKIIYPLTHADLYRAYGKSIGGGILLYGPPGCGKTYLARATAGEIKAGFISIGLHDVLDMWIGQSERRLHELFERARRNRPCVLFFDEVDALGASRSDMKQSAGRHLINQFLNELDGAKSTNDGVLILGATNAPWHLDSAFRRPGRFDRILFVPPPDALARAAILRLQMQGKPAEDVDYDQVGKKTEGFSGADLKAVVDVAIEHKLRDAVKSGVPTPLRTKDLLASAGSLKPTTRDWFATARNYALYANEGGTYDDILKHLKL